MIFPIGDITTGLELIRALSFFGTIGLLPFWIYWNP